MKENNAGDYSAWPIDAFTPEFPCWLWNTKYHQWFYFNHDMGLIRWWQYTHWQESEPVKIDELSAQLNKARCKHCGEFISVPTNWKSPAPFECVRCRTQLAWRTPVD